MDKKQGSDDAVKRGDVVSDEDDTEGQKVTHRAIPDESPGPDGAAKRSGLIDDEIAKDALVHRS